MAIKKFQVPSHALSAPEVETFAGRDVTVVLFAERDTVRCHMSRQHAEALRAALDIALARLDCVAASVGVGPKLPDAELVLPIEEG
jgi:hypothetical protein